MLSGPGTLSCWRSATPERSATSARPGHGSRRSPKPSPSRLIHGASSRWSTASVWTPSSRPWPKAGSKTPHWVQNFDVAFAGCYLDNLHRHLREEKPTPPWEAVYRHCDTDPVSITAIVAAALNAHLISDLPEALHASAVRPHHFLDYQTLSRRIWATASTALAAIEGVYGIDLSPMYHAKPLTWPMNTLIGRTAATQEQLFHTTTGIAFGQGLALANPLARPLIRAQMTVASRMLALVIGRSAQHAAVAGSPMPAFEGDRERVERWLPPLAHRPYRGRWGLGSGSRGRDTSSRPARSGRPAGANRSR